MRALNRKTEFTSEDRLLMQTLDEMTDEQERAWRRDKLSTYHVGDYAKCVLGGGLGIWIYGIITDVNDRYATIRQVNKGGGQLVATPHPLAGLQHVSYEEFEAARLQPLI